MAPALLADEFVPSKSGKVFASINPASAEKICDVSEGFAEDIDAAVEAAAAAFRRGSAWRTMDASARGGLMWKLADLLERDREIIAKIEALDNGKPYAMANGGWLLSCVSLSLSLIKSARC